MAEPTFDVISLAPAADGRRAIFSEDSGAMTAPLVCRGAFCKKAPGRPDKTLISGVITDRQPHGSGPLPDPCGRTDQPRGLPRARRARRSLSLTHARVPPLPRPATAITRHAAIKASCRPGAGHPLPPVAGNFR